MTRYVAFLRAINVGGRNVTMSVLAREFERIGLADVETFIASGNVIFSAQARSTEALESRIEQALQSRLGYDVATFVRTEDEVRAVSRYRPFPEPDMQRAVALNVGFVAAPLSPAARRLLQSLSTDIDAWRAHRREIYWMCLRKQSESTRSNAVLERTLKVRATFRGLNTIARLASRLDGSDRGKR